MFAMLKAFPYLGLAYRFPLLYRLLPGEFPYTFTFDELDQAVAIAELPAGALVVDIACGQGVMALHLARQRTDIFVIGIDSSAEMLAEAVATAKNEQLHHCAFALQSSTELSQALIDRCCREHHFPCQPPTMVTAIFGLSAMSHYAEVIDNLIDLLPDRATLFVVDLWRTRSLANHFSHFLFDNLLLAGNSYRPIKQYLAHHIGEHTLTEKCYRDEFTGIGTMEPFMFRGTINKSQAPLE